MNAHQELRTRNEEETEPPGGTPAQAYAFCERLARRHYENFPVATRLLPRAVRPHVAALYAFARTADDFADEGSRSPQERHQLLDEWSTRLHACATGESGAPTGSDAASLVFTALGHTIGAHRLPLALFDDLLSAFRQDITTHRYPTWDELLDYCRRSANPVGRLVLRIAGYEHARLDALSDSLCTALQLTNFWQDLELDWRRGRLYVPASDRLECGADEADLDRRRITPHWRSALERMAARTHELFRASRTIADEIPGRIGFELRLTWLAGVRTLERLERARFDVFTARPSLGAIDATLILGKAICWRRNST